MMPDRGSPFRRLAVPLAVSLGVVLILFAAYELFERVWLAERHPELLFMAHRLRGFVAAVVAAVLAAWLILRTTPPMLAEPVTPRLRPQEAHAVHYHRWFVRMRWLAVLVAVGLVTVATGVLELLPQEARLPLLLTIAALGAANVAYEIILKKGWAGPGTLRAQAYIDLGILALLLHFSGGLENPLSIVMLFHVIIAGVVLSTRDSIGVAAAGTMLVAAVAFAEWTGVVAHYGLALYPHPGQGGALTDPVTEPLFAGSQVALHGTILFLTAYFTSTMAGRIRRDERRLMRFAGEVDEQRQLLERSLETTGSALFVCDETLEAVWSNRRWKAWFGRDSICGGVDDPCQEWLQPVRQALSEGATRVMEVSEPGSVNGPNGEHALAARTFRVTTACLLENNGHRGGRVALAQDITEEKVTAAGMIRAERLAAVGELAGGVAHEVNNPIAIISAKARLLLVDHSSDLSPAIAAELEKIVDLSDRVARIAQGLLTYCRPTAAVQEPLDVCVPLRKALSVVEGAARTGGVTVIERLPEGLPLVVGNSGELTQVFLNLLVNALDAMPGGGRLEVRAWEDGVECDRGSARVAVLVEDTGMGIPGDVRERMFEPFFTTKPEGKGTGLGASICLGLVKNHGGEIEVESEAGTGTWVTVYLPASPTGRVKA